MSYTDKLLNKGSFFTRLSHRGRLQAFLQLIKDVRGASALDWGCADGFILKKLLSCGVIESGIGIDIDPGQVALNRENFKEVKELSFFTPDEFRLEHSNKKFDLVLCTETLEHVQYPQEILSKIRGVASESSTIIISVPIEVGPSLLIKQFGRFIANLKGNYGYPKYRLLELVAAGVFWNVGALAKERVDGHKGFDYRVVCQLIKEHFLIKKTIYSPFYLLGALFNSTVYWVLRRK